MSSDSNSAAAGEDPSPPPVLAAVTTVLERLVARNERVGSEESASGGGLAAFRAVRAPTISIGKYMERIYRYTGCSPSCFVVGFVYMDRAAHRNPGSLLVSLNVHRLIVTSLLIASKFLDDLHHNNAFFARVGGITNTELNRLELELLFLLDFGVMVTSRVFQRYCLHLETEMMWSGAAGKIERSILYSTDCEPEQPTNGTSSRFSKVLKIPLPLFTP